MKGFSKKGVKWFAIVVFIIMAAAGIIIFAINKKSTSYVQQIIKGLQALF